MLKQYAVYYKHRSPKFHYENKMTVSAASETEAGAKFMLLAQKNSPIWETQLYVTRIEPVEVENDDTRA